MIITVLVSAPFLNYLETTDGVTARAGIGQCVGAQNQKVCFTLPLAVCD